MLKRHLTEQDLWLTTVKLTLLGLILFFQEGVFAHAVRLSALVMLFHHPLCRSKEAWFLVTAACGLYLYENRFVCDNHLYLFFYWVVAIFFSFFQERPFFYLQRNARVLLSLAFALAFFWKIRSPDFINGNLISFTAITRHGVGSTLREWLFQLPPNTSLYNLSFIKYIMINPDKGAVELQSSWFLDQITPFLTYWTIGIEATIALGFFLAFFYSHWIVPHLLLIIFQITTYTVFPVMGFGYILSILGLGSAEPSHIRMLHLAVLVYYAFLSFIMMLPAIWASF